MFITYFVISSPQNFGLTINRFGLTQSFDQFIVWFRLAPNSLEIPVSTSSLVFATHEYIEVRVSLHR